MLAFVGGDSRNEILTAPTKNPKSGTVTSTEDDAELLKDLRGLDKPPLFDENDTYMSFFLVSEDDSTLLRHMEDALDLLNIVATKNITCLATPSGNWWKYQKKKKPSALVNSYTPAVENVIRV